MGRKNLIHIINEEGTIDIPEDLEAFIRRNILEAMGCTLAGIQTELARQVIDEINKNEVTQESTIIGDGGQTSVLSAFKLNSTLSRLEVHKDKTYVVPRRPGQRVLFAALSAGEQLGQDLETVIGAIVVTYELILQVGRCVLPIAWLEDEPSPKTGMEACFTMQGLAIITETIMKERIGEGKGNVFAQLLLQILALLASPRPSCDSDLLKNDELVSRCRELISQVKFTKSALRKCLVHKTGFQLTYLDHFMEAPTRALSKALRGSKVQPEKIERILFKSILWLDFLAKEADEDIKAKLAYATCICSCQLDPCNTWYLNGLTGHPAISDLTKKVLLVDDFWDLVYACESGKNRCMVQINHADGMPLIGKLVYEIYHIRHFRTSDQFKEQIERDAMGMIGPKQTEKLCTEILNENLKISEIMKLTYPRRWPADILGKWGWLVKH